MAFMTPPKTARGRDKRQANIAENVARLDRDQMRANIVSAFLASDQTSGADWYSVANGIAADMADRHGVSIDAVCGILAALSAGTDWDRNIALAETMLATNDCKHKSGNAIEKARKIRNGADPADVLGGRKVRSFYANIVRPFSPGPVTIDRHAFRVARFGTDAPHVLKSTDAEAKVLEKAGVYITYAAAYRGAAAELSARLGREILPHAVQSVTWVWLRSQGAGIDRRSVTGKNMVTAA